MRRITVWILTTISAVVLLFGYRTSTGDSTTATAASPAPGTDAASGASPSTTSATAPSTGTGTSTGTTVAGSTEQTRWGPVQVQITVADKKITAVDVLQVPSENHRDQEINSDAVPTLVDETMSAQSAKIDMVSGATVTSTGYIDSLQSALDEAGITT